MKQKNTRKKWLLAILMLIVGIVPALARNIMVSGNTTASSLASTIEFGDYLVFDDQATLTVDCELPLLKGISGNGITIKLTEYDLNTVEGIVNRGALVIYGQNRSSAKFTGNNIICDGQITFQNVSVEAKCLAGVSANSTKGIVSNLGSIYISNSNVTVSNGNDDIAIFAQSYIQIKDSNIEVSPIGNTHIRGIYSESGDISILGESNVKIASILHGIYAKNGNINISCKTLQVVVVGELKHYHPLASTVELASCIYGKAALFKMCGTYTFGNENKNGVVSGDFVCNDPYKVLLPEGGSFDGDDFYDSNGKKSQVGRICGIDISGTASLTKSVYYPSDEYVECRLPGIFTTYKQAKPSITWQIQDANSERWLYLTNTGDNTKLPITDDLIDKNVRAQVSGDIFTGSLITNPALVTKLTRDTQYYPDVYYSASDDKLHVTNGLKDVEYVVTSVSSLSSVDWSAAVSPSADGDYALPGGTKNTINYVAARYKATGDYYAGTPSIRSCYYGTVVSVQGIELHFAPVEMYAPTLDEYGYVGMPLNSVMRVDVRPIPSNATNFNGVYGTSWYGQNKIEFYADKDCTTPISTSSYYKTVYAKFTTPGNAIELSAYYTKGYNDVARAAQMFNVADANGNYEVRKVDIPDIYVELGSTVTVPFTISPANMPGANISATVDLIPGSRRQVHAEYVEIGGRKMISVTASSLAIPLSDPYVGRLKLSGTEIATFNVYVTWPKVKSLSLATKTTTLNPGDSLDLGNELTVLPKDALLHNTLEWKSSNSTYITVDEYGLVKVAEGDDALGEKAIITVRSGEVVDSCEVTVSGMKYKLAVNGVLVNSINKDDILGDGTVSFDGGNTLTLNNVNYVNEEESFSLPFVLTALDNIIVKLKGNNYISLKSFYAIGGTSNIIFTGNGQLTIDVSGNNNDGVFAGGATVTVTDLATLKIKAATPIEAKALRVNGEGASLTVNGSMYPVRLDELTIGNGYSIQPSRGVRFESFENLTFKTFVNTLTGKVATDVDIIIRGADPDFVLMGDVNSDKYLLPNDVTMTIDRALGKSVDNFSTEKADIYADTFIDVADVVGVADIVLNDDTHKPAADVADAPRRALRSVAGTTVSDRLIADAITLPAEAKATVEIELNSGMDYTAFMLDVVLPNGVKIAGAELGDRAGSHSLIVKEKDGVTRLMSYSMGNAAIAAGSGTLLRLELVSTADFAGTGEISLTDVVFTSRDNNNVFLPTATIAIGDATDLSGITEVKAGVASVKVKGNRVVINSERGGIATVTTINGISRRLSLMPGANEFPLERGIYIITVDGESVKVKI